MGKKDREKPPEVVQVIFVGKPFRKSVGRKYGRPPKRLMQIRRVRIAASWKEQTGEITMRPAKDLPITVSDFPHVPIEEAEEIDVAETRPTLTTARKKGASTSGVDMEEVYINRGGKGIRIRKEGGFSSPAERRAIRRIRHKKGPCVDR